MTQAELGAPTTAAQAGRLHRARSAVWPGAAGVAAVAVMLGVSELLAALLPSGRSHVVALGDEVIDRTPGWLERAVIANLGTSDKPFLIANILLVSGLLGVVLGVVASRRFVSGALGIAGMAAVGTAASLADPQAGTGASIAVGAVGAAAGIVTLRLLVDAAPADVGRASDAASPTVRAIDRRRFLRLAGGAAAVAALGVAGARLIESSERIERIRRTIRLPRPDRPAPPPPPRASLAIAGLTPLYVPNGAFYRIDTALSVPKLDPDEWSLEVRGRVDRPFRVTYAELLRMPQIEADVTLACVSNEVGGDLVGNARWQGVPLHHFLERAGVHNEATQIVGRSVDRFTAGFPTLRAIEDDEAMVAIAMNGEPLPLAHGFPARLVVPGLYGYVSATKWLASIDLLRLDEFNGFWIPRGWSKFGPIKTQSRIDVPQRTARRGRLTIGGVAWAPTRGIERVEVRVDDLPWQEATLAQQLDVDAWRQWFLRWEATPGKHRIAVRATDGTGETQTEERSRPDPNGATGHHTIEVDVT